MPTLATLTVEMGLVLAITLAFVVALARAWFPSDGAALGVLVILVVTGLLPADAAFRSFGNEALVTIAAMFVLSAGLTRTGAVDFVGRRILALGRGREPRTLAVLMIAVAVCSAFVNNTPIAVIFLPIVMGIAAETGIAPSKLLLPMSYATIVGGMCTVIGTSTNVLVAARLPGFRETFPAEALEVSLFAPLPLAVIGIAATVLYMVVVGRRLLPVRTTVSSAAGAGRLREYLTEIVVPPGSPYVGRTIGESIASRAPGLRILQLVRDEEILPAGPQEPLRAEDAVLVKGEVNALLAIHRAPGLDLVPDLSMPGLEAHRRDTALAELVVRPTSAAIGERVRDLGLHARHGLVVLAVQRHGMHVREKVADVRLRFGDVLLVQTDARSLNALRDSGDFVVVEGVEEEVILSHRAGASLAILGLVVGLAAVGVLPISVLALAGAIAMVSLRCLGPREAYRALDLPLLVLMAGSIGLGIAIERTGAATWLANGLVGAASPWGDVAVLAALYLVCNLLTALISNAGAALITLPIALATAEQTGMRPMPFVIAVMFAASIDFSTPIGYQTNTFVYGPGGYRFSDYVRVGVPLNLIWWILSTALIPVLWPLR